MAMHRSSSRRLSLKANASGSQEHNLVIREDGEGEEDKQPSLISEPPMLPQQLAQEQGEQEDAELLVQESDLPMSPLFSKQSSASKLKDVRWANADEMVPILPEVKVERRSVGSAEHGTPRRSALSVTSISPHALERLGVDAEMLKREKGMKKLGISDVDIVRSEELLRYSGITRGAPTSKVEFMFGFNDEQLHRAKAVKQLGTTEQEILDDYSRRVSKLGISVDP